MGAAVFTSSFHHVLAPPLSKENHVLLGEAGTEMVHLEIDNDDTEPARHVFVMV